MKRNFLKVTLCLVLALLIGAAPMSALAAGKKDTVVSILKCTVDGGRLRVDWLASRALPGGEQL